MNTVEESKYGLLFIFNGGYLPLNKIDPDGVNLFLPREWWGSG